MVLSRQDKATLNFLNVFLYLPYFLKYLVREIILEKYLFREINIKHCIYKVEHVKQNTGIFQKLYSVGETVLDKSCDLKGDK